MADMLLNLEQYRAAVGAASGGNPPSERTVRRWIADDRMPGLELAADGSWLIPADAEPGAKGAHPRPQQRSSHVAPSQAVDRVTAAAPARRPAVPTLPALLAEQPAYLDLDTASQLLGIPVRAIRRNRDHFGAVPFGDRGRLVVPQSVVRAIAGVTA